MLADCYTVKNENKFKNNNNKYNLPIHMDGVYVWVLAVNMPT